MVLVSGSLAFDRIMDFPGRFADHVVAGLPEQERRPARVDSAGHAANDPHGNLARYQLNSLPSKSFAGDGGAA